MKNCISVFVATLVICLSCQGFCEEMQPTNMGEVPAAGVKTKPAGKVKKNNKKVNKEATSDSASDQTKVLGAAVVVETIEIPSVNANIVVKYPSILNKSPQNGRYYPYVTFEIISGTGNIYASNDNLYLRDKSGKKFYGSEMKNVVLVSEKVITSDSWFKLENAQYLDVSYRFHDISGISKEQMEKAKADHSIYFLINKTPVLQIKGANTGLSEYYHIRFKLIDNSTDALTTGVSGQETKKKCSKFGVVEYIKDDFCFFKDVVVDTRTWLMWARELDISYTGMTWDKAIEWANNSCEYGGYKDWRLPTKDELAAIANRGGDRPSIYFNKLGFRNVKNQPYWSSSIYHVNGLACFVDMFGGDAYKYTDSSAKLYVWPVRTAK